MGFFLVGLLYLFTSKNPIEEALTAILGIFSATLGVLMPLWLTAFAIYLNVKLKGIDVYFISPETAQKLSAEDKISPGEIQELHFTGTYFLKNVLLVLYFPSETESTRRINQVKPLYIYIIIFFSRQFMFSPHFSKPFFSVLQFDY